MPRVRDIAPDEGPDPLRATYLGFIEECGPFRNQLGVLAHVPPALEHLMQMLIALKTAQRVPRRYIELAVVAVSRLNAYDYCVAHHGPMLAVEGLSAEGVDRVLVRPLAHELDHSTTFARFAVPERLSALPKRHDEDLLAIGAFAIVEPSIVKSVTTRKENGSHDGDRECDSIHVRARDLRGWRWGH